jgi:hypothetical protein
MPGNYGRGEAASLLISTLFRQKRANALTAPANQRIRVRHSVVVALARSIESGQTRARH